MAKTLLLGCGHSLSLRPKTALKRPFGTETGSEVGDSKVSLENQMPEVLAVCGAQCAKCRVPCAERAE